MDNARLLVVAMSEQCKCQIQEFQGQARQLPMSLRLSHLKWMCDRVKQHADDWTEVRSQRWIGFIQCAMIAHGILELAEAKQMFDTLKVAYGEVGDDLVDHLDAASSFEVDIGGEG